jgi:hypothetical protein
MVSLRIGLLARHIYGAFTADVYQLFAHLQKLNVYLPPPMSRPSPSGVPDWFSIPPTRRPWLYIINPAIYYPAYNRPWLWRIQGLARPQIINLHKINPCLNFPTRRPWDAFKLPPPRLIPSQLAWPPPDCQSSQLSRPPPLFASAPNSLNLPTYNDLEFSRPPPFP